MKGKTDYEIARRYLKAVLNFRESLLFVRNPFIDVSEMERAVAAEGLPTDTFSDHARTNRAVYTVRWKKVKDAWVELEAEIIEAEVSWGTEAERVSRNIFKAARQLLGEVNIYLSGGPINIVTSILYNSSSPDVPDAFSQKVINAIDEVRNFLKPHLE